jgi:hypothetical protein
MSLQERESPATRAQRRPASLACYQCRRKHLKCDGAMPVCARCTSTATTCTYLPSRRGLSGRQEQHQNGTTGATQHRPRPPPSSSSATSSALRETHGQTRSPSRADASFDTAGTAQAHANSLFSSTERTHLIGQYYSHFHRSHPMLVPRAQFYNQHYPEFLVVTCCVVGHHFASRPSEACISTAVSMAISAEGADVIFRIQAFILLALVFLGSHEMGRANDCLDRAASLSREARLDSSDTCNSQDSATTLQREYARRTFWELYAVDSILALLEARPPKLKTQSPQNLPFVPHADSSYEAGDLGTAQRSYADFERRLFLQDTVAFSAHFYRIEAANLVRRVCHLFTRNDADLQELESASNDIASWFYNLTDSSFTSPESPEESDQILLQAHLLVQVASIFLHFPRSNLPSSGPSAVDVTCLRKALPGMENSRQHAIKSIAASKELCHIASMPSMQESHSPLAICGFLLGCAVQLSAASLFKTPDSDQKQCRNRVVLMLGALRYIGKAWPGAQSALHHLQPFADTVFTTPSHCNPQDTRIASGDVSQDMIGSSEAALHNNVASEYDPEPMMSSALQENPLDINWFDFFQPDDTSGQLPMYGLP